VAYSFLSGYGRSLPLSRRHNLLAILSPCLELFADSKFALQNRIFLTAQFPPQELP
jgi:hypothetical protein